MGRLLRARQVARTVRTRDVPAAADPSTETLDLPDIEFDEVSFFRLIASFY